MLVRWKQQPCFGYCDANEKPDCEPPNATYRVTEAKWQLIHDVVNVPSRIITAFVAGSPTERVKLRLAEPKQQSHALVTSSRQSTKW